MRGRWEGVCYIVEFSKAMDLGILEFPSSYLLDYYCFFSSAAFLASVYIVWGVWVVLRFPDAFKHCLSYGVQLVDLAQVSGWLGIIIFL